MDMKEIEEIRKGVNYFLDSYKEEEEPQKKGRRLLRVHLMPDQVINYDREKLDSWFVGEKGVLHIQTDDGKRIALAHGQWKAVEDWVDEEALLAPPTTAVNSPVES